MLTDADDMFTEMAERGVFPDLYTLTTLIRCRCIKPTLATCNTVIKGYYWSADALKADEFLGRMIAEGVTPDSISYSTLINGFVREDHMDKAFLWMNKMEKEGLLPDIITYNVVMNGFCRHGRMQEAELVLRKMIKKGITPDPFQLINPNYFDLTAFILAGFSCLCACQMCSESFRKQRLIPLLWSVPCWFKERIACPSGVNKCIFSSRGIIA
ncbi:hypothetical protein Peur_036447 [Populus x canadensis]